MTTARRPLRVSAVDNLDVVRLGLLTLPMTRPDVVATMEVFADVGDLDLTARPPDVLVLDYWLGHENTPVVPHLETLGTWTRHLLLYTSEERPAHLRAAMHHGATGLCLKTDGLNALAEAIRELHDHGAAFSGPMAHALLTDEALGARLTPRECEILQGLSAGFTVADLAEQLYLSVKTVQTHVENVRRKYTRDGESTNRASMIRAAQRDGYLADPGRRPLDDVDESPG